MGSCVLDCPLTTGTNMGRIKLERAKKDQVGLLRDINQKLFPILSIAETSDDFYKMFVEESQGFSFIAYHNNMLAGVVCCELTENDGLYIRLIGTLNRHRRKGVGKAMLSKVMEEARKRDIHNVYTFIRVDNKAGFHLGRKFGLISSGTSKTDPRLVTVERIFHREKPQDQTNRS